MSMSWKFSRIKENLDFLRFVWSDFTGVICLGISRPLTYFFYKDVKCYGPNYISLFISLTHNHNLHKIPHVYKYKLRLYQLISFNLIYTYVQLDITSDKITRNILTTTVLANDTKPK